MVAQPLPGVGVGIYTLTEAARLLGVAPRTARRWINGYTFAGGRHSDPVFEAEYPVERAKQRILNFQDLIELFMVQGFRAEGWSLRRIRLEGKAAREEFRTKHPFATRRVLTDGKYWYQAEAPLTTEDGEVHQVIRQLPSRQLVFAQVIKPFLKKLDYEGEEASAYWPLGKKGRIVIDRAREFGKPIDNETSIPTHALYDLYEAGDSIEEVARWYHVSVEAVRAAVDYEKHLRKA